MARFPNAENGYENGMAKVDIFAVPLFTQKAMSTDWIFAFGCWFWEFDSWPLNDISGKMISMLKIQIGPKIENPGA